MSKDNPNTNTPCSMCDAWLDARGHKCPKHALADAEASTGIQPTDSVRRTKPHPKDFPQKVIERYWSHVTKIEGGCWEYSGTDYNQKGYKVFNYQYNRYPAHRVSYELLKHDINPGLVVDHLCRNKVCVNPDHLEAVTDYENRIIRGYGNTAAENHHKTVCKHGHPLTPENTYVRKNGNRNCRTCRYQLNKIKFQNEVARREKEFQDAVDAKVQATTDQRVAEAEMALLRHIESMGDGEAKRQGQSAHNMDHRAYGEVVAHDVHTCIASLTKKEYREAKEH